MSLFIGKIESIEEENIGSPYYKKVVTIKKDRETAYFEFRNRFTMKFLDGFSKGENVAITYLMHGSITRNKMRCNNLIAQSIEKVE